MEHRGMASCAQSSRNKLPIRGRQIKAFHSPKNKRLGFNSRIHHLPILVIGICLSPSLVNLLSHIHNQAWPRGGLPEPNRSRTSWNRIRNRNRFRNAPNRGTVKPPEKVAGTVKPPEKLHEPDLKTAVWNRNWSG